MTYALAFWIFVNVGLVLLVVASFRALKRDVSPAVTAIVAAVWLLAAACVTLISSFMTQEEMRSRISTHE